MLRLRLRWSPCVSTNAGWCRKALFPNTELEPGGTLPNTFQSYFNLIPNHIKVCSLLITLVASKHHHGECPSLSLVSLSLTCIHIHHVFVTLNNFLVSPLVKSFIYLSLHTSRKHGEKEPQLFFHCGSFDHPGLHSLNNYKISFFILWLQN